MSSYLRYLEDHCRGGHFAPRELCVPGSRTKAEPPQAMWRRILPTLRAANLLRRIWGEPIVCVAAYRPEGGARYSQHKFNRALDLDCAKGSNVDRWREVCSRVFDELDVSMGHYLNAPRRVHIDTRGRRATWLYDAQGRSLKPTFAEDPDPSADRRRRH